MLMRSLILVLAFPGLALAADVDSSDISCDDATGSSLFCTIQAAIDDASSGDTINISEHDYTEQLTINIDLTLQGDSISTTRLIGNSDIDSATVSFSDLQLVGDSSRVIEADNSDITLTRLQGLGWRQPGLRRS